MNSIILKRAQAYARHALAMKASQPITSESLWQMSLKLTAQVRGVNHG